MSKTLNPATSPVKLQTTHSENIALRHRIEDLEDLQDLVKAVKENARQSLIAWDQAKKELDLE